jgi:hypothetical protein
LPPAWRELKAEYILMPQCTSQGLTLDFTRAALRLIPEIGGHPYAYPILILIAAAGLVGAAATEAPDSSQTAVWTQHKLLHFLHPSVINSETGQGTEVSCDQLYNDEYFVLRQLGARPSDSVVDERPCYTPALLRSIDVTFSVLAPTENTVINPSWELVPAHRKTVELRGDRRFLEYVTQKVLPLISTKDAKYILINDRSRLGGIGLYAKVVVPAKQPVASR